MDTKEKSYPQKKTMLKHLTLTVGALTLACLLQGCSGCGGQDDHPPATTTAPQSTSAVTQPSTDATDPTETLRTYYEKLIADLRQELLDEREDRYISDHQYQNRLEALEETIAALEEALTQDVPTQGEPTPEHTTPVEQETEPPQTPLLCYDVVEGQAYITGYTGTAPILNIPAEIDGYTVVAIEDEAFQNSSLRSVILPATIKEIGWFAFSGCYELELVSIPASVEKIQYGAFDGCPSVTILCPAESYAAAYVVSFGLSHQYV